MKIVLVLLLLVSATAAINEWLGVPERNLQQLEQLLDGMYLSYFTCFLCVLNRFVNVAFLGYDTTESIFNSRLRNVHGYLRCTVILAS